MGGLDGCRGGGGRLSLVVLVSEKPNLVSEKSGKSQGILIICGAGNPVLVTAQIVKYCVCFQSNIEQNVLEIKKIIIHQSG